MPTHARLSLWLPLLAALVHVGFVVASLGTGAAIGEDFVSFGPLRTLFYPVTVMIYGACHYLAVYGGLDALGLSCDVAFAATNIFVLYAVGCVLDTLRGRQTGRPPWLIVGIRSVLTAPFWLLALLAFGLAVSGVVRGPPIYALAASGLLLVAALAEVCARTLSRCIAWARSRREFRRLLV